MWYILDAETLEKINKLNSKREAIFLYSENGKSKRIRKGVYLVTSENSHYAYESYIVHEDYLAQIRS